MSETALFRFAKSDDSVGFERDAASEQSKLKRTRNGDRPVVPATRGRSYLQPRRSSFFEVGSSRLWTRMMINSFAVGSCLSDGDVDPG